MKNIAEAIVKVMAKVKGIEKSMTVGNGNNSYQGVPDKEVKKIIGEAMVENGLCILPTGVTAKTEVSRWEENVTYNGQTQVKQKQSVFTEVTTKYLLLHESGESIELEGYGHGVDAQDKGAGKATTYALKYALLYSFLVPTGKIDDADVTHSETIETPKAKPAARVELPLLLPNTEKWAGALKALREETVTLAKIKTKYRISATHETELLNQLEVTV